MKRGALLLTLAAAALAPEALAQCSMCQTALTQSVEGQRIAGEFNRAILVMVASPYLVAGSIAGWVLRSRIRAWFAARRSR